MVVQSQQTAPDFTFALVAVGSNLATKELTPLATLSAAIDVLQCKHVAVTAQSRVYRTPAFPAGSGPDFVNAALMVETTFESQDLLAHLHTAEAGFGRERNERWAARTLDLDLLAYGSAVLPDLATLRRWMDLPLADQMTHAPDQMLLPHPRMHQRGFVLGPLMDIAPDWMHPVLGQTVRQMYQALPPEDRASLQPLT